jgi:ribonuclease VapC
LTLVIDTSAIIAILGGEAEAKLFTDLMVTAMPDVQISAGTLIECYRITLRHAGRQAPDDVDCLLRRLKVAVTPVDSVQVAFARDGMERFGKGRGAAPAVLNFGDLFAYSLARSLDAPLLFKGNDFTATDIVPAWTA